MLKIIGMIFCGLTLTVILKQIKAEYSYLLRLALVVPIIAVIMTLLQSVFADIADYTDISSSYGTYFTLAVKILGVCYLSQTGADICRDCSENTLATQVEFIGRISVVMVSLPIIKEILSFSISFISG